MNWLFLVILVLIGGGGIITWRSLRPDADGTRVSPVPGYAVVDGRAFKLDPIEALERGVDWWPQSVEEFHSRGRARVVLRFGARASVAKDQLRELLDVSGKEVASRTQAHVVYLEAHVDGQLACATMWAPDGRGWSGGDPTSSVWYVA